MTTYEDEFPDLCVSKNPVAAAAEVRRPVQTPIIDIHDFLLIPTDAQRRILNKWIAAARCAYNACLSKTVFDYEQFSVRDELRAIGKEWTEHVPIEILEAAVRQFYDHVGMNALRHADTAFIKAEAYSDGIMYPGFWMNTAGDSVGKLRGKHTRIPRKLAFDAWIVRTDDYQYILRVKYVVDKHHDYNGTIPKQVAFVRPGVSEFLLLREKNSSVSVSIGLDVMKWVREVSSNIDYVRKAYTSNANYVRTAEDVELRPTSLELEVKIRLAQLHAETVEFLCSEYDEVVIEDGGSISNDASSATERALIAWSRQEFVRLLMQRASTRCVKVKIV